MVGKPTPIIATAGATRVPANWRAYPPVIERASSTDLMELASDSAGVPTQVAAVLVLDSGPGVTLPAVREAIAGRVRAVPRLRQRLVRAPFGCGRPYWADDPGFDVGHHVGAVRCPAPGDEQALLDVTAETVTIRLPQDRPLWSATLVTDLADGKGAIIIVIHHVLADGIGGLAVLAHLVDGAPMTPAVEFRRFPAPQPSGGQLLVDAMRARFRAAAHLPAAADTLRHAVAELRPRAIARPPRCSLNQTTGQRRILAVARVDLSAVRAAAHRQHATVNDVALAGVSGALQSLLHHRGEVVDRFVISVPVSARRATTAGRLGNQVGVLPVEVAATGDPRQRLAATAEMMRERKTAVPGASAALLAPTFRVLARLGVLRWYVNRQRRVNTFVTNLRGPDGRLSFLGATVIDIIPISLITGNVTVAFAVLSYAGTLVVTVVCDPYRCPDLPLLVDSLQRELDMLAGVERVGPARR